MSELYHFNRNHESKDGRFTYGDGDGDGVSNDHGNPKDNKNYGDNKNTKSYIVRSDSKSVGLRKSPSRERTFSKSATVTKPVKVGDSVKFNGSKKIESKFTRVGSGKITKLNGSTKAESKFTRVGTGNAVALNGAPGETEYQTNVNVAISQLMENAEDLEKSKVMLNNIRENVVGILSPYKAESGLRYVSNLLTSIIGASKKETKVKNEMEASKPSAKKNTDKEHHKSEK